ncbi:hypothetical protein JTE90_008460 [Oedothorax gibbosus]|uniref:Uncharacterized protein n=1 Tax=Oedothorax gibbosus TaxID=931172 RepID=A0AAV6V0X3_9ARAC|nr:hypothetical protein JTE90_008460 [Oedothorax gibbosus]
MDDNGPPMVCLRHSFPKPSNSTCFRFGATSKTLANLTSPAPMADYPPMSPPQKVDALFQPNPPTDPSVVHGSRETRGCTMGTSGPSFVPFFLSRFCPARDLCWVPRDKGTARGPCLRLDLVLKSVSNF